MKESRTAKAVSVAWDVIVKSMRALGDEDRDVPLAHDLFHVMGCIKLATLLGNKRGLNPEIVTVTYDTSRSGAYPYRGVGWA